MMAYNALRLCGQTSLREARHVPAEKQTGEPGGSRDSYSMRHLNHTGYFSNGEPGFTELMDAIAGPRVLSVCRSILGYD